MAYIHGAYGEIVSSQVSDASQSDVVAAYIGTAPINLIRGYADLDLINYPIRIANMSDAQQKVGYATDWEKFTLCEALAQHFDNTVGNIGPIYLINVLNPDAHKSTSQTEKTLTFANNRAEFESNDIILDTFAIADKAEGVDYALEYNFAKGTVIVRLLQEIEGSTLECSFYTVDTSKVLAADIIGQTTANGEYTGLHALKLLYQAHNAVLNILAAPGWSQIPEVYQAMVSIVQKLNGHWDGFVNADLPLVDLESQSVDTIAKATAWAAENGYNSEFSKVFWPQVKDDSGRIFHLSTVATATMLRTDLENNGIPFESPSNKTIMATAQYFGATSTNRGFDQETANGLNEKGITTACFWGGQWVLWGPHTAAYSYGADVDARAIFDCNIRMLMYLTNQFQLDHGTRIDAPMTPQERDTILNFERQKMDTLLGVGALVGTPSVEFIESENPTSEMVNGNFVWHIMATPTPPLKSATVRVGYTDEGFQSFFESE